MADTFSATSTAFGDRAPNSLRIPSQMNGYLRIHSLRFSLKASLPQMMWCVACLRLPLCLHLHTIRAVWASVSTAMNLAFGLAAQDKLVLLVDMDSQANLTRDLPSQSPDAVPDISATILPASGNSRTWFGEHSSSVCDVFHPIKHLRGQIKALLRDREPSCALCVTYMLLM
jgi:hypothetical protein